MGAVTIDMVSADLSHEETILQIADALDTLDKVTNHLFDRLQNNIETNCDRLQKLDGRVKVAAKKVEMLQDSKKATCIYSSAKYPASDYSPSLATFPIEDINRFQRQLHRDEDEDTLDRSGNTRGQPVSNKTRQSNRNRASKPIQNSFENRDLNEKLHFYHIKPKSKSNNRQWDAKNGSPGRVSNVSGNVQRSVPSTISSVSSLLVYNTEDNVFRSEDKDIRSKQQSDKNSANDNVMNKAEGQLRYNSDLGIAAAPDSMASSNHGGDINDGGGLLYVPELADLPEFEMLPDFLDLPNIAFDESYGSPDGNAQGSIAPSVNYHQPMVHTDTRRDNDASKRNSAGSAGTSSTKDSDVKSNNAAPTTSRVAYNNESANIATPPTPPPPPPPPPPSEAPPSIPQVEPYSLSSPPPPPPEININELPKLGDDDIDTGGRNLLPTEPDNGRSGLLAAIRASGGAGGAGLKKASERQVSSVSNTESSTSETPSSQNAGGGLDLMGEISRKLAMRRKGMSGKVEQGGGTGNTNPRSHIVPKPSGAMDKISSMIPPPPPTNNEIEKDEDSDDDW